MSCTWYRVDEYAYANYMQMRICIVKLGVVSSIYGYFGEETEWRHMYSQSSADWVL